MNTRTTRVDVRAAEINEHATHEDEFTQALDAMDLDFFGDEHNESDMFASVLLDGRDTGSPALSFGEFAVGMSPSRLDEISPDLGNVGGGAAPDLGLIRFGGGSVMSLGGGAAVVGMADPLVWAPQMVAVHLPGHVAVTAAPSVAVARARKEKAAATRVLSVNILHRVSLALNDARGLMGLICSRSGIAAPPALPAVHASTESLLAEVYNLPPTMSELVLRADVVKEVADHAVLLMNLSSEDEGLLGIDAQYQKLMANAAAMFNGHPYYKMLGGAKFVPRPLRVRGEETRLECDLRMAHLSYDIAYIFRMVIIFTALPAELGPCDLDDAGMVDTLRQHKRVHLPLLSRMLGFSMETIERLFNDVFNTLLAEGRAGVESLRVAPRGTYISAFDSRPMKDEPISPIDYMLMKMVVFNTVAGVQTPSDAETVLVAAVTGEPVERMRLRMQVLRKEYRQASKVDVAAKAAAVAEKAAKTAEKAAARELLKARARSEKRRLAMEDAELVGGGAAPSTRRVRVRRS